MQPTAHVMHRLYITCFNVDTKALSDDFSRNAAFARVVAWTPASW
jgi:hypothetical protein